MNILDFFDKTKPLQQIIYPGAQVGGKLNVRPEYYDEESDKEDEENKENQDEPKDYAEEYIQKDLDEYKEAFNSNTQDEMMMRPESVASVAQGTDGEDTPRNLNEIFSKYNFAQETRPELVMNSYEETICGLVAGEQTVIIQGPTGCGKSTQVPQYVLNWCQRNNKYCRIAVTQPRRIAAVTVARRVSEERGWPLGSVVGYKVGLDSQTGPDTVLTYMTTGVLLQQLVAAKNMSMYSHIILDEVHERDQEMDFLMLIVRKLSRQQMCRTKIILMSATFDTDQFSKYFARPTNDTESLATSDKPGFVSAPVIDVVKQPIHSVNIYHLDQLEQLMDHEARNLLHFNIVKAEFFRCLFPVVQALLTAFDRLDVEREQLPGSVLIFLPGIYEIEEVYEYLKDHEESDAVKWLLLPLHSSITVEEQKRAFEKPLVGHRKIILSTNIAESSITVPDVVYVIDFCLTKILVTDPSTNYSHLKLTWASRNSCIQRAGRVGRVRSGRVYRFVYNNFLEKEIPERTTPEILRCPLHRVVLLAKLLDMGPPHSILALALDRPDLSNIKQTVEVLKESGALLLSTTPMNAAAMSVQAEMDDRDGDLTTIGRVMARLPLDINSSRLIILGHVFGVLKETIIMAAAMMLQNIFSNPFNERMKSYVNRLTWSYGSYSDLIAYLHVYMVWESHRFRGALNEPISERNWMTRNFLQPRIMREWRLLINDLVYRLKRIGIDENAASRASVPEHEKAMLLKIVICGAFYPNYFVRSSEGGQIDEQDAVRSLGGRDPYTTVYFTGKQPEQPGQLYVKTIKNLLKDCATDMRVTFDSGTSGKVYIQFPREESEKESPFRIASAVYRAVKYRQLKLNTNVPCLSAEEGRRRLELWRQEQNMKSIKFQGNSDTETNTPGQNVTSIVVTIAHIASPSCFFVHDMSNPQNEQILNQIYTELNSKPLVPASDPVVGVLYAAPYQKQYYRAKCLEIHFDNPDRKKQINVLFIDYGIISCVSSVQLYMLPRISVMQNAPLAIRCTLARVRPPVTMSKNGEMWPQESTDFFLAEISNSSLNPLFANIYSVVDNVCSLELYQRSNTPTQATNQTINDLLIQNGLARTATETFLSQEDHICRQRIQNQINEGEDLLSSMKQINFYDTSGGGEQDIPPPPARDCRRFMKLAGPFSALEMRVFSLTHSGGHHKVVIENNSVNSVLLDNDPQDPHDRLLVAGSISTNSDGSILNLRHTTLMPSVPGLPVLMGMLWAPRVALHTDRAQSRITSVLCGVGYNERTLRSLLPGHDIVFNLDFDLTCEDMVLVNEIREYMNQSMEAIQCCTNNQPSQYAVEKCQFEIRSRVRTLLKRSRRSLERKILPNSKSWQKAVYCKMNQYSRDIWPLHAVPEVPDPENRQRVEFEAEINKQIEEMQGIAERRIPMSEMTCNLCNRTMYEISEVRAHLLHPTHKNNVMEFELSIK